MGLLFIFKRLHVQLLPFNSDALSIGRHSATSGLVGDFHLSFLPPIPPLACLLLVLLFTLPVIIAFLLSALRVKTSPHSTREPIPVRLLVKGVVYGALTSFMLGYHVHEKAILVALIPATLLVETSPPSCSPHQGRLNAIFLQCAAGGIVGLLPLLAHPQELLLKGQIASLLSFALLLSPCLRIGCRRYLLLVPSSCPPSLGIGCWTLLLTVSLISLPPSRPT
jgi:hypothetical protein